MSVVVVGQVARDLVLRTEKLPGEGGSETVLERLERLGGKGANQAVGLAQLGARVSLVGVAGSDDVGASVIAEAAADGIDVTHVVRRGPTALLVTLIDGPPSRRLLEDIPPSALLTGEDISRAAPAVDVADTVSIQLQQPADVVLTVARRARDGGARVIADGALQGDRLDELLESIDVLRADAAETDLLAGEPVRTAEHARDVASNLLEKGPELVAFAVADIGDVLVWPGGHHVFPLSEEPVIDSTGAGDAFVAGLITALRRGASPVDAGALATAAAASTVQRLGGRPDLAGISG